jgi:uncharacterized membrane protein YfhO
MKKDAPFLLIIVLATLLLYTGLIFFPDSQLFPAKDWWGQHRYWKSFLNDSFFRDHEIPLWNPMVFSGEPFLGHPTASTYFYPLNILFIHYNPDPVFKFYLIFHTLLAGLGMFYLVKRLLDDRFIALFGSIAFIFGGAWIAKISYGQLTNMVVISYVPMLFLILIHLWRKPGWTPALTLGLVWGMQFNAGNLHLFYICALSMGFFILYLSIEELIEQKNIKALFRKYMLLILGSLIAIGIGAGQLLPSMETAAWSIRTLSDYNFCTTMSLPAWHMLSFLYPNIFGSPIDGSYIGAENYTELYGYAGIFPILLVLCFLFGKRNKEGYPWLFLAGLSLVLSFGRFTPVYKIFYKIIPGMNLFRIPSSFLFIYVFALIVTSCFGLKKFLARGKDFKDNKIFTMLLICLCLLTVFILAVRPVDYLIKTLKPGLYSMKIGAAISIAAVHSLILIIIFSLLYFIRIKRTWLVICLIIFLALDLLSISYPLLQSKNISTMSGDFPWLRKISEDESYFRIYDIKPVPQQTALRYNLQKITGLDPIILKHYFNFTNLLLGDKIGKTTEQLPISLPGRSRLQNPVILDILNVKYIISDKRLDEYKNFILTDEFKDKDRNSVYLYKNITALPRAWIVHRINEIENYDRFQNNLKGFNPVSTALIVQNSFKIDEFSESADLKTNKPEILPQEKVIIIGYRSNRIFLKADVKKAGLLVLSEVWMPGWSAKVNGRTAPVIRTDYILRGIPVDKGINYVELRYFPRSFVTGVFTTFTVSFIVLILLIAASVRKVIKEIRPYVRKALIEKTQSDFEKKKIL